MKVPVSLMGVVSAGALVSFYPSLLSSNSEDIKNTKHIEIFFYKNNGTTSVVSTSSNFFLSDNYSILPPGINPGQIVKFGNSTTEYLANTSMVSTGTTSGSAAETARIKIPMDYLDKISKYEYCFTSNNICTYKKFSSSESSDEIKFVFFSEIAKKFISVQHYINLIKAKQYHESTKKNTTKTQTAATCACSTDCKNCTCTNTCNGKSNGCCCVDGKITALDDDKKNLFLLSISNLVASYKNLYFAPAQAHIFLNNFQDSDLTNTEVAAATAVAVSSTSSNAKKTITGMLLYKYVDYYYKVLDNADINWISQEYKQTSKNESVSDDFINYPLTFEYTYDKNSKSLKKDEDNKNGADCSFNLENVFDEQSDKSKLLKSEKSKLTNQLVSISQIGTIKKSDLSNIKDILSKVCNKCT